MKLRLDAFKRAIEKVYAFYMRRYGFTSYYYANFKKAQKAADRDATFSKEDRKWAKDRGFFPWRIKQYGLSEENYRTIISEDDYYYLYPLNNKYRIWIDDKLTTKYVLAPFNRFLPEYYYHLLSGRDIMRLMDCPQEYTSDSDGLIALLREKKLLAAKKSAGSLGVGFYKLEADGEGFVVNGKILTESEFRSFLKTLDDYIITEFVDQHPLLNRINPYSVNTIRATVINAHGNDAIFPFAFLRIGTKQSGIVDNVSRGGMVCKIDTETGRFYDGETLNDHVYQSVEYHPDTKERLEGVLPNWELIKQTLLEITRYCPELKWLGFDIAITEDGFKIIEINSHQQLHKAHEYPPVVTNFLFEELNNKKNRYHRRGR